MPGNLPVSVVIPVYNDAARLAQCLQALSIQSLGADRFEVIVVDNGSNDSPERVVTGFPFARCLVEPLPGSYNARNTGAAAALGACLAFTDSDCRPDRDWLVNAVDYFNSNPGVSAIGGRIELDCSGMPSAAELYERIYAFRQERYVGQHGFAATANLIVRRDAFEEVGPFDGNRKSGGDLEWGQRLVTTGLVLQYVAQVTVHHPARSTLGDLIRKRRRTAGGRLMTASSAASSVTVKSAWIDPQPRGFRMLACLLFRPHQLGLLGTQGWRVLGVLGLLWIVDKLERWRLRLKGVPLR